MDKTALRPVRKRRISVLTAMILGAMLMLVGMVPAAFAGSDADIASWDDLQQAINESSGPVVLTLQEGITLTGNAPLTIPAGCDVTIDMKQSTIRRDLSSSASNGGVIVVSKGASLTLSDGTVSGGRTTGTGGGIVNHGTAVLSGCTVSGNSAGGSGGGIWSEGSLTVDSCTVSGNTASDGGGIYVSGGTASITGTTEITGNTGTSAGGGGIVNYGTVSAQGRLTVSGNTTKVNGGGIWNGGVFGIEGEVIVSDNESTDTDKKNFFLSAGKVITINGQLGSSSKIGVCGDDMPRVITSGWNANNRGGTTDIISFDNGESTWLYGDELGVDARYIHRNWDEENASVIELSDSVPDEAPQLLTENPSPGWYCSWDWKAYGRRITINSGTVNLILLDGDVLSLEKGIYVRSGATLNIYGQTEGSGKIIAGADEYYAAIGGNDEKLHGEINIHGGTIEATGGKYGAGIGTGDETDEGSEPITILGGTVTAKGGTDAAGIGGGNEGRGAIIRIYGGDITARGGENGSGIGAGDDRGPIRIDIGGGKVYAVGGAYAAGIGEGYSASSDSSDGTVNIFGRADVTAKGGRKGAGIGGGCENNTRCNINISGGTVNASGDDHSEDSGAGEYGAAGIGSGVCNAIYVGGNFEGKVNISGGKVTASASGRDEWTASGQTYAGGAGIGCSKASDMKGSIVISGGEVEAIGRHGGAAIGGGADGGTSFGDCSGSVSITGGTVRLNISDTNAQNPGVPYIGHGAGANNNGELTIGDSMKVWFDGQTPVNAADRKETCRTTNRKDILIVSDCDHEPDGISYEDITADTHTAVCRYCGLKRTESHVYDGSSKCTACSYVAHDKKTVSFDPNGGTGDMQDVSVTTGSSYTLPQCGFEAPADKLFKEWSVATGEGDPSAAAPGDDIIVSADTVVAAQWADKKKADRPKAKFKAGGPDKGTLTDLAAGGTYEYWIGDSGHNTFTSEEGSFEITGISVPEGTDNVDLYIIKKGSGSMEDSDAQSITLYKPEPPEGLASVDCTARGDDGMITGVTSHMEYKLSESTVWKYVLSKVIDHLSPGRYQVRIEANGTQLASESVVLTIRSADDHSLYEDDRETAYITYDLNGGEYDGSTDDIIERHTVGEVITVHEAPVREGYEFSYWKGSEYQPGDLYTVEGDHTLTAVWTAESGAGGDGASDTSSGSGGPNKGADTGDDSELTVMLALFIISAFSFITLLLRRRRCE